MRTLTACVLASALAVGVVGCAAPGGAPVSADAVPAAQPPRARTVSRDLLYDILVAEMAQQGNDLDRAIRHYLHATRLSRDPAVAERGARVALRAPDHPDALELARLWVSLDPEDMEAHQAVAALYLNDGNAPQALLHFQHLLERAEVRQPGAGYLLVTSLLRRAEDKTLAVRIMERIVAARSSVPEARFAYAVVAQAAGRNELAAAQARQALDGREVWPAAWSVYLQALGAEGLLDQGLDELRAALARNEGDNRRLRLVLGRTLMENRRFEEASSEFARLLEAAPDDGELLYPLAILALNMDQTDTARRYLGRLVELEFRADEARYYLGQIAESAGDVESARAWYQAVSDRRYLLGAQIRLARLSAMNGALDEARARLQSLRSSNREEAVRLYLAESELLRETERFDEQMALLDDALTEHPGDADLLYARALTAERLDRIDWAERDLRAILEKDAQNAAALNALGYTLADRTPRLEEAYEYIRRALEISPDDAAVIDSMGWVLYRMGRNPEAIDYLRRAHAISQDAEIAAHLGEVLWVSGERSEAREIFARALQRQPDSGVLRDTMRRLMP